MTGVVLGFVPEPLMVPLDKSLPSRKVPVGLATPRKTALAQASEDAMVVDTMGVLAARPELRAVWRGLTPGEQRGLAHQVAQAKSNATVERRVQLVMDALASGR